MEFYEVLDQILDLLRRRGRMSYRALQRQFHLDDALIEDVKEELLYAHPVVDDAGRGLIWTGEVDLPPEPKSAPIPESTPASTPLVYTPRHLTEKILAARTALEGERKQVTVLFADIKDSTELIKDLDPEMAQRLLDPAIHIMMQAVHRYEGTVNQILGDGIMALFGAPLAHEDHALRASYAALAMQAAMRDYTEEVRRAHGMTLRIRVGLNAGEVVVRAIGNDLHMDYSAVGQTTHLAARMEQLAAPGSIMLTAATLRLIEGLVRVHELGPVPVKGMAEPVAVFELAGASAIRRRLQASIARGLTRFVGRETEIEALRQAMEQALVGRGHVVATVGEAGLGKSRLMYEFVHSHRTQEWLILESASVSYGKAAPYFPVVELLKHYVHIEEADEPRTIRAKVTGQILTLDEALHETIPPVLFLLEALPQDSPFLILDPPQRRQRTLDALKRILLRESQVQPLLLVFEDLHWIDAETQALLDSLVASLPTARLLLAVNYRPEYHHAWGSKTYYTQLRLDPLPPVSANAFLQALLGDEPSLEPLKQLLIARTEGNPFFLEESVRTLVEIHALVGQPGAYRLGPAASSIQVPATVQAVLAARIDRLPAEEKRLVQTAAVIGTEVPLLVLQAIVNLSEEELQRGLAQLQEAEFLYETRLFPEREYTFKHALTQQVAYQSLLTSRRQQIHGQIAQVLAESFPETADTRPELLAHHYTEAALAEPAVAFWHKAGQKAIECSAYVEAMAHLRKGLEVLHTLPETTERAQRELPLQVTLAESLAVTQGHTAPEVIRAYTRVHELCRQVGETSQLFFVFVELRRFYAFSGELQTAQELAEQLGHLARHQPDAVYSQEAHWALGQTLHFRGEFVPARTHLEQSIACHAPQPLSTPRARSAAGTQIACHLVAGWNLWTLGYPDQALNSAHESLRLAHGLAHPFTLAVAMYGLAVIHQRRREVQAVHERAEALMALALEQGFPDWVAAATAWQGWTLAMQGQAEAGMEKVRQVLTSQLEVGRMAIVQLSVLAEQVAEVYGAGGQAGEGLRLLAEALAVVDKTGERSAAAGLHRLKGVLLLAQSPDNSAEAEAAFHQALTIARRQGARSWELRAAMSLSRLWQQQGKQADARQLLAEIYSSFTEGFDTRDLQDAKALMHALTS